MSASVGTPLEVLADTCEDYAARDRRPWAKLAELADRLDPLAEPCEALAEAIANLRAAVDDKDSAMDEPPIDRADSLGAAWDMAVDALEAIATAARELEAAL